ncbi:hypothetical protein, partial [Escherichia coli]
MEVWGPFRSVRWNGQAVPVTHSVSGSLIARRPLPAPQPLALPDLTAATWRYAEGSPEARRDFDDS